MEIKASVLKQVLSEVLPFTKQNSSVVDFTQVHFTKSKAYAFNGEIGLILDLTFEVPSAFTVSPHALNKLVSQFSDEELVTLSIKDSKLKIACGNLKATFTLSTEKYSSVQDLPEQGETISISDFPERLSRSNFCCATDAFKENLQGVFITQEAVFATDGRRFYYEQGKSSKELVVPSFLWKILLKEKESPLLVFTSSNKIGLRFTGKTLLAQQVSHQSPNAKALVDQQVALQTSSVITYDSSVFKKELIKLLVLNQDINRVVTLSYIDNSTIQIENKESSTSSANAIIKCSVTKEFTPVNFQGEHLKDAVSQFVELQIKGEKDPILFSDNKSVHILSRIKNF